ncbi:hypothetical protein CHARACLAT_011601 [Characodon lateralis]|uniref:Uncharacterized protein n=1 Tax=Characodon lateralis TaxID=208331 RepID=A0ABU7CYS3_9TELE|nr:hypothetical protein [Characodon lateralis]
MIGHKDTDIDPGSHFKFKVKDKRRWGSCNEQRGFWTVCTSQGEKGRRRTGRKACHTVGCQHRKEDNGV